VSLLLFLSPLFHAAFPCAYQLVTSMLETGGPLVAYACLHSSCVFIGNAIAHLGMSQCLAKLLADDCFDTQLSPVCRPNDCLTLSCNACNTRRMHAQARMQELEQTHKQLDTCVLVEQQDVLMQEPRAGVLRPSFCLVKDDQLHSIVLAIRGTHSLKVCCVVRLNQRLRDKP